MEHTLRFTDREFVPEVLEAEIPVLVDFWAVWCRPCQHRSSAIDRVAAQYAGLVKVGRLDVDENRRIPIVFEIHSLPSLLLFHRGRVVDRLIGPTSKAQLEQLVGSHLPPKAGWPLLRRAVA